MNVLVPDQEMTRDNDLASWQSFGAAYYEPILRGSVTADEVYRTPLFARPPELMEVPVNGNPLRRRFGMMVEGRLEPFHDRAAIESGALAFCCGPHMRALYDALPPVLRGGYAPDAASLAPLLIDAIRPGDLLLVKGSFGSRMRDVIAALAPPPANAPQPVAS